MLNEDNKEESDDSSSVKNNSYYNEPIKKKKNIEEEIINTDIKKDKEVPLNNQNSEDNAALLANKDYLSDKENYSIMKNDNDKNNNKTIKEKISNNNSIIKMNEEDNLSGKDNKEEKDSFDFFDVDSKDEMNESKKFKKSKGSYTEKEIQKNINKDIGSGDDIDLNLRKNLAVSNNNTKEDKDHFEKNKEIGNSQINKDNNISYEINKSDRNSIYSDINNENDDKDDSNIEKNSKREKEIRDNKEFNNEQKLDKNSQLENASMVKNESIKEDNLDILEKKMINKTLLKSSSNSSNNNISNEKNNFDSSSSSPEKDTIKTKLSNKEPHPYIQDNSKVSKRKNFEERSEKSNSDNNLNNSKNINISSIKTLKTETKENSIKNLDKEDSKSKNNKSLDSSSNNSSFEKDKNQEEKKSPIKSNRQNHEKYIKKSYSNSEDSEQSDKNKDTSIYKRKQLEISKEKLYKNESISNSPTVEQKKIYEEKISDKLNLESDSKIYSIKDEYYIKYIKSKRKGFQNIVDRNYISGFNEFSNCFEISKNNLQDKIKQIDSLINMSICEYYKGNFNNSLSLLENAKKINEKVNYEECNINMQDIINLNLKLFANSSMANLSFNNYKESISDVKKIIEIINNENNIKRKRIYLKNILLILFKVETLLNIPNEKQLTKGIKVSIINDLNEKNKNDDNNITNDYSFNDNEKLMADFLYCIKYRNYMILLNSFIENGAKFKKNNNLSGYYFCLFNQYLISYNNIINIDKASPQSVENDLKDLEYRLNICNKNLIGEEILTEMNIKNKKINKFLEEFNQKMDCSSTILSLLENLEIRLSEKNDYEEKKNANNNIRIDKDKIISSGYFVKLSLMYSCHYLLKKKKLMENEIKSQKINKSKEENEKDDNDIENEDLKNINKLLKELEKLIQKINNYEIDISYIKSRNIDKNIIKNITIIFQNLLYIYHRSLLYRRFHGFKRKVEKYNLINNYRKIDDFFSKKCDAITKGMNLIKINYGSKGYKMYFYNIDLDSNTLNSKILQTQQYPDHSYNLFKDISKVLYGLKSPNLVKKILNRKGKEEDSINLLRFPWRILSLITKKRSIDLYCEDDQLDNLVYGLKQFTNDNNISYKIFSANKFVLNKIKYKIVLKLMKVIKNIEINDKNDKYITLVRGLSSEVRIHTISFAKLFLLYNIIMNKL